MDDSVRYRPAYGADRPAMAALWQQVFGDSPETIRAFYDAFPQCRAVVAENKAGDVVAVVHVLPQTLALDRGPRPVAYLYAVATRPDYRGRGICRGLMAFCEALLARLGYALASPQNDVSLQDLARLTDVFYIGGTKVGALFGEAVVISHPELARDFRYHIKQRGGMLAKGWLLGLQFDVLLENDRYMAISRKAVAQAMEIKKAFEEVGVSSWSDSYTNQLFPILPNEALKQFDENYVYNAGEKLDEGHTVARFCTSWAPTDAQVQALIADIHRILG